MAKLRLELTDSCNYKCFFCHHDQFIDVNKDRTLSADDYGFLTKVAQSCGIKVVTLSGGEPLLRKDINEIINKISKNNVYIQITTNGFNLNKLTDLSRINGVNISIHSINLDTHKQITNTKYAIPIVMENLDYILTNKKINVKLNVVALKDITITEENLQKLLNVCADKKIVLKIIELLDIKSPYFVSLDEVDKILKKFGFVTTRKMKNNIYQTNGVVNVVLQRCLCPHAHVQKNPGEFCNKFNDIFVYPSGVLNICRESDADNIDIYDDIKERKEVSLKSKIFLALDQMGKHCC